MDLTNLSDADLLALKAGDYSKMSDGGLQALKASSAPAAPQESYASDAVKSIGSGLEQGTATAIGMPGDIASIAHAVAPQSVIDKVKAVPGAQWLYNHLPTKQAVLNSSADPVVDPNYQPQTAPGRYAQAITANAGPGLATGMGVPAVLGGAVAGQGVEDLTGSKTAGAVANIAGSIAAPMALARLSRQGMMPLMKEQQVKDLANAGYADPAVSGTAISPQATTSLAGDMQSALDNSRSSFSPARAPRTTGDIGRLADRAAPTAPAMTPQQQLQMQMNWQQPPVAAPAAPVTIEELHNFRKDLRDTAKEVGPNFKPTEEAAAAMRAQRVLNQYLENIPAGDVTHGNPADAVNALNQAGRNWKAYSGADQFGNIIENAQLRANGQGSGANFGNLMRQESFKLLKDGGYRAKQMGASPEAMGLLNKLNEGDFATNMLRRASNYMGGGGGVANHAAAALFGHAAGPVGYLLGATVGPALRAASNARTLGTAKRVQEALLKTAPINASIAARNATASAANKAAMSGAAAQGIPNFLLQALNLGRQ